MGIGKIVTVAGKSAKVAELLAKIKKVVPGLKAAEVEVILLELVESVEALETTAKTANKTLKTTEESVKVAEDTAKAVKNTEKTAEVLNDANKTSKTLKSEETVAAGAERGSAKGGGGSGGPGSGGSGSGGPGGGGGEPGAGGPRKKVTMFEKGVSDQPLDLPVPASRNGIEALADSYRGLSNSQRPATVARLTPTEGSSIAGRSTSGNQIHDVIRDFYANRPAHPNNLQCAEIDTISQALRANEAATGTQITTIEQARAVLRGSTMQTARVRPVTGNPARVAQHGTSIPPCENGCDLLLRALGIGFE